MLAFIGKLPRRKPLYCRELKVALPLEKGREKDLEPGKVADGIWKQTEEFKRKANHVERQMVPRLIHGRIRKAAEESCDYLIGQLQNYPHATHPTVIGATAHSLSFMQDYLWESSFIPDQYDALVEHVWYGADRNASKMSVTDVSSMMYACYTFRHFLPSIRPRAGSESESGEGKPYSHKELVRRLLQRYRVVSEMGTNEDALSVLLGMTAVRIRHEPIVQELVSKCLLPQVYRANVEVLGNIAWVIGQLRPLNTLKVMDPLVHRFTSLKSIEIRTMDIDVFANVLCGLACVRHRSGQELASKFVQHLERAKDTHWKPRSITRLAWGVAQLDAHTPSFVGRILRETIRSGRFFTVPEVQLFRRAVDDMNIEPADEVWQSLAQTGRLIEEL